MNPLRTLVVLGALAASLILIGSTPTQRAPLAVPPLELEQAPLLETSPAVQVKGHWSVALWAGFPVR